MRQLVILCVADLTRNCKCKQAGWFFKVVCLAVRILHQCHIVLLCNTHADTVFHAWIRQTRVVDNSLCSGVLTEITALNIGVVLLTDIYAAVPGTVHRIEVVVPVAVLDVGRPDLLPPVNAVSDNVVVQFHARRAFIGIQAAVLVIQAIAVVV